MSEQAEYCEICTMDRTLSVKEDFCCEPRQIIYLEEKAELYKQALEDIVNNYVAGATANEFMIIAKEAQNDDQ